MATAFISGYIVNSSTKVERTSMVKSYVSDSGIMRLSDLGQQAYYRIAPVFELLSNADKEALVNWLAANETTEIALTVGSEVYNGYIQPEFGVSAGVSRGSNHLWDVRFSFLGIKQ